MKNFQDFSEELNERMGRDYGIDYKLVPTGKPGKSGYRKVRARAITWQLPPDPRDINSPNFEDSEKEEDDDKALKIYTKYYKKYIQTLKNHPRLLSKASKKKKVDEEIINEKNSSSIDPPFVLTLKRVNVRLFPDDIKVALYFNDKLKKYFSVTYGPSGVSPFQAEETELIDEISEEEKIISLLKVFQNLTEENQNKLINKLQFDKNFISKLQDFVLNNEVI